ncbi:hypothetical protein D3C76_1649430 [compost metagenome]
MSLVGKSDRMCPIEGVELLAKGLLEAYQSAGKPEYWRPIVTSGGHMETLDMRMKWQQFLVDHL